MINVFDEAGDLIEMHEHKGDFREWSASPHKTKSRHAVKHDGSLLRLIDQFSDCSAPFASLKYIRLAADFNSSCKRHSLLSDHRRSALKPPE
jgi:hypothetical protein